MNRIFML